MHLQVLASGSRGNATLVRAGETHVLVDCGLAPMELGQRFAAARYEPLGRLGHILLSHGHLDHARGAGALSKRTGATVHCAERLMKNRSLARARRLSTLRIEGETLLGSGPEGNSDIVRVRSVKVPHDADPTVAFKLEHAGRVLVHMTDVGWPRPDLAQSLAGAHVLVLEFNHDRALLQGGPYSQKLRARVGGDRGHLSNDQAAALLRLLAGPELHTLVLAHLSEPNNRPLYALAAARAVLAELGLERVQCLVASQDQVGPDVAV